MICEHIYKNRNEEVCSLCGKLTHNINWEKQNLMYKQWLLDNPDSEYIGWTSI